MDVGGAVKLADGSADFLVPPAEIADAPAGGEIHVLLATLIEEERAFRADELHDLGRLFTGQISPVALHYVHDHLRRLAVGLSRCDAEPLKLQGPTGPHTAVPSTIDAIRRSLGIGKF